MSSRPGRELGICAALGLLLLAVGLLQRYLAFDAVSSDWPALARSVSLKFGGTPLATQVLAFLAALLFLHLALGVGCWLLAAATRRAFPALRATRLKIAVAWFGAVVLWLLVANATLFPWSASGVRADFLRTPLLAAVRPFDLLSLSLVVALLVIVWRCLRSHPRIGRWVPRALVYGCVALLVLFALRWRISQADVTRPVPAQPNIILIGVDSLRPDVVGEGKPVGVTPNIDLFLREGAHVFTDAITPLARTFPAWTAILSGRNPVTTNAREDLMGFDQLRPFPTIASLARARGYHTVQAIDEVRFSNIDETFGFDQLITPPIGAADFLLGKANDFPLTNVIANTWLGRWLFPVNFANRATAHVYSPADFVDRLDAELPDSGPLLLAVHFTLPHHPYHWAEPDDRVFNPNTDKAYQYLNATLAADAQVGALLHSLERRGALANAIVVLLSDHGEALGLPGSDTLLSGPAARGIMEGQRVSNYGHGSSVLSPSQYAVVLAIRGYGPAMDGMVPSKHAEPVSLIDIAPTVLDLASIAAPPGFDGDSLRPLLAAEAAGREKLADRIRFTETGFRTPLINAGNYDERGILGETAAFFRMNPAKGRFEIRPELMSVLLADKERAALSSRWLLAAIPGTAPAMQKYLLLSRAGEAPRRIEAAPDGSDPELARLWKALHDHYGAEMKPPQPAIARTPSSGDKAAK